MAAPWKATAQQPSPAWQCKAPQARTFHGCSKISDYEMMKKLGEGTFGEVHQAKHIKTGRIFALKKILMHNEKDGFPITALREIKLLKLLDHVNVLRLEEMAVEHAKKDERKKRAIMYMVTPYMDHDLSGLLENPNVHLSESQIKCYLKQLLQGTAYLHSQHILHRDMKAANLLINNQGILQIADFGLARHYVGDVPSSGNNGGEGTRDYTTLVVTRWYRPPELLLQLRRYTPAIDLWGVGCVFGEMLVGKPILAGESDQRQLEIIFDLVGTPTDESMPGWKDLPGAQGLNPPMRRPTLPDRFRQWGPGAISLLAHLLKLDWRKRLNAIDALEHSYFKTEPLPARPEDLPMFESSHELDRRDGKGPHARGHLPPAPRGYAVGEGGGVGGGGRPYANGDNYGGAHRNGQDGHGQGWGSNSRGPPRAYGGDGRRPAWQRDNRDGGHPPPRDYGRDRDYSRTNNWGGDGSRSDNRAMDYRDRHHGPRDDRRRGPPGGGNVDTYIPPYHREDRSSWDDRRRYDDRDDRRRLDYDDRGRQSRTRSRSPNRTRERDSVDRDVYGRR